MIQAWMLALAVSSNSLQQPQHDQPFEHIKALRAQELQELQAASRARQMQHELTVAAAQQQIQQLGGSAVTALTGAAGLSEYELLAVVQGVQQLVVLKHHHQLLRLVPGEYDPSGLLATIDRAHVRLQRGQQQRLFALPRGW